MSIPSPILPDTWVEGVRSRLGERGRGALLALALEALLILAVLTLGAPAVLEEPGGENLTSIEFSGSTEEQQAEAEPEKETEPSTSPVVKPDPEPAPEPKPVEAVVAPEVEPLPQPVVPTENKVAKPEPAATPKAPVPAKPPSGAMMGPPVPRPRIPDSPRVPGSGPNGEPLYAASWYREPRDDELSGYLSTATGPGWGLIACRTAPDYRVEDCFAIDEYPVHSNITRSILAAAWQFKVRPPRIGGRYMVGEWVRIRIDYGLSPR